MWGNVIIVGVLTLPLAVLATLAIFRLRRRAGHPAPLRTSLADVWIAVGTAPWIWMILTPVTGQTGVSLVPFKDLLTLISAPWDAVLVQVGGNLLVFAALGALLPVRTPAMASLPRVAAVAALCSTLVEILQYGLRLGRYSSVDDVIVNTAGAVLAALITRRWWARSIPAGTVPR